MRHAGFRAALIGVVALVAVCAQQAIAAAAKVTITLTVSNGSPHTGENVRVVLRSDLPLAEARTARMRVLSLPPGTELYAALRDEKPFLLTLTRRGSTWYARTQFARKGTWRLVVPNFGAPGFAVPPPIVLRVDVLAPT